MKKIKQITFEKVIDECADISWIGKFANEIPEGKYGVAHDGGSRHYPYFVSCNADNQEHAQADYDRMMEYERGEVNMYGLKAVAETQTSQDGKTWTIHHIESAGLWGIESDAGDEFFRETWDDQLADLRADLRADLIEYGFTAAEIDAAPKVYNE